MEYILLGLILLLGAIASVFALFLLISLILAIIYDFTGGDK